MRSNIGVRGTDISEMDLSGASLADMFTVTYDSQTKWPSKTHLPRGFDPIQVMRVGQDPGLGLRTLHKRQITGRGVSIAVIDKPILPSHREFSDRIHYIEVSPGDDRNAQLHYHGAVIASMLAGRNVGVAPDSTIYYFAVPDSADPFLDYTRALARLLELNSSLPVAARIRVVNISAGYTGLDATRPSVTSWESMIRQAEQQGVAVVHCGPTFPLWYLVAGSPPNHDRNTVDSYEPAIWLKKQALGDPWPDALYVPGDYRTGAGTASPNDYVYFGEGGNSWAAPYLSGLVALAIQKEPSVPNTVLLRLLNETSVRNANGIRVLNPTKFLEAVEQYK